MRKKNLLVLFNDVESHSASFSVHPNSFKGPGAFSHMPYHEARELGRVRALKEFPSRSNGTIGTKYRFRAECRRDAELFLRPLIGFIEPSWSISHIEKNYPDVEGVFILSKEISPRDLLWLACSIIDGHVLAQTLEKENDYTGDRDFYRDFDVGDPKNVPSPAVLNEIKRGLAWYVESLKHLLAEAKAFASELKAVPS